MLKAKFKGKLITVISMSCGIGDTDFIYYTTKGTDVRREVIDWNNFEINFITNEKDQRWSKLKKYILSDSGPLDRFDLLKKIDIIENESD